jgi:hypothetical protein
MNKGLAIAAAVIQPESRMPIDTLKRYAKLRQRLISEKATIEARLRELNQVLGGESAQTTAAPIATTRPPKELVGYVPRRGSLPAKILKIVEKSGRATQVKDIAAAAKGKPLVVTQACLMLLKKGRLRREGRGHYALA